jgi:hypothetical protein
VIVDAEEPEGTSASNVALLQLNSPTPVTKVAGPDEVFVIVVAGAKMLPGSRRRVVWADAELEPSARRASAAIAASVPNFRIDI